ncbi:protein bax [Mangrovibacter plantisponsor]|uniref:Bax protein n=1 Tax=Mangrovibacter plantisponsor TaxID=451513 RepID=A0A317PV76_9ENTR|nr:protein bax [Mangrovibacter plantisponsor]PWW06647.1 Bax protein [Mangrovibacter plantisponsor]
MMSTRIRRYGATILMCFTLGFSGGVLAKKHETTTNHKPHVTKVHGSKQAVSSKQEYSRNSASSSLPDLRKYPSGAARKKAFLRTVMPYINRQNDVILADREWLQQKRYAGHWTAAERTRLKGLARQYNVSWRGDTRRVPWNTLLDRIDIIPTNMVATMAAAESGWGTSKLARVNNNLFGMKCGRSCSGAKGKVKGYSQFSSVDESVQAYVRNLNTHPAYSSFRKSRSQLRRADQELTAANMIHKLEGYSTKGSSYNNYLFAMFQSNKQLLNTY